MESLSYSSKTLAKLSLWKSEADEAQWKAFISLLSQTPPAYVTLDYCYGISSCSYLTPDTHTHWETQSYGIVHMLQKHSRPSCARGAAVRLKKRHQGIIQCSTQAKIRAYLLSASIKCQADRKQTALWGSGLSGGALVMDERRDWIKPGGKVQQMKPKKVSVPVWCCS